MGNEKDRPRRQGQLVAEARALAIRRCRDLLRDCERLLESMDTGTANRAPQPDLKGLQERDLELIRLICHRENWTYGYIAVLMKLKLPTLHRIRRKVFKALGVRSKIELVRRVEGSGG